MTFLLLIILAVWIYSLQKRVTELEERAGIRKERQEEPMYDPRLVEELQQKRAEEQPVVPEVPHEQVEAPTPYLVRETTQHAVPISSQSSFDLFEWLKQGFLIKFGALLLFLGIAWFVSYAFSEGWVSPAMRIALGFLLALGVYGLSHWRLGVDRRQGVVLNALGTAIVMAVVSAAQFAYLMFPPTLALAIMVAAIVYTVFIGIRLRHETLVVTAAVAGLIAPMLTNDVQPDMSAFFAYLLVYTLAFIWVAARVHWISLVFTLLVGVGFYQLVYYSAETIDNTFTFLVYAFIFGIVFFVASLFGALIRNSVSTGDLYVGAFNSLLVLFWIQALVPESFQGTVAFIIALIAGATAYTLFEYKLSKNIIYLHAALAGVFLIAATAFEFRGSTLVLLYALESGLVIAASMLMRFSGTFVSWCAWSFTLPAFLSLASLGAPAWEDSWLHPHAYALYGVLFVAAVIAGIALYRSYRSVARAFVTIFIVYFVWITWLVTHAIFTDIAAASLSLVVYALLSTVCFVSALNLKAEATMLWLLTSTYALPILLALRFLMDASVWSEGWLHFETLSIVLLITMLFYSAYATYTLRRAGEDRSQALEMVHLIAVAGSLLTIGLIWQIAHAAFTNDDSAVMASLFIYVLAGLVLYILGRMQDIRELRIGAGFLLGGVVVRLLLVDVWQMEIVWRVFTFVGIGALFIATSFLESANLKKVIKNEVEG